MPFEAPKPIDPKKTLILGGVGEKPPSYPKKRMQVDARLMYLEAIANDPNAQARKAASEMLKSFNIEVDPDDAQAARNELQRLAEAAPQEKKLNAQEIQAFVEAQNAQSRLREEISAAPSKESLKVHSPVQFNMPAATPELIEKFKRDEEAKKKKKRGLLGNLGAWLRGQ